MNCKGRKNMKSILICIVLSYVLLAGAGALKNPSFESKVPLEWKSGVYIPAERSEERASDGRASVLLTGNKTSKMTAFSQDIDLQAIPGEVLKLTCDIFPESFSEGILFPIYLQIRAKGGVQYSFVRLYPQSLSRQLGQWQKLEHFVDLRKYHGIKSIRLSILASANYTGRVFIDNLTAEAWTPSVALITVPESDSCKNSTIVTNLWDSGTKNPATERSLVKIRHDKDRLCFDFELTSYALNPVSNQRSSFKSKHRGRDQAVWEDDCMEIRLEHYKNGIPAESYYIGFNADSALTDMRRDANGWNEKWNGDIRLKSAPGNGKWTAQLDIGMKSLGMKRGDDWRINIVRFDQRLKKSSVLVPAADHQDMSHAARLILAGPGSAVKVPEFTPDALNRRRLDFMTDKGKTWKIACIRNGFPLKTLSGSVSNRIAAVGLPGGIQGSVQLQISISDGQGKEIWRTPLYPCSADDLQGKAALKSSGVLRLFINGAESPLNTGFSLPQGAAVVAIQAQGGKTLDGSLKIGSQTFPLDASWKYMENPPQDAVKKEFDDRSWKRWNASVKTVPGQGSVLLRKTIMRNATTLLPVLPDNTWRLTENGTYLLQWAAGAYTSGEQLKRPMNDFELLLEYTDGIKYLGTGVADKTFYYLKKSEQPKYITQELPPVKENGTTYRRIRIRVSSPVTLSGEPKPGLPTLKCVYSGCNLVFEATAPAGSEGTLRIRAAAEQGNIVELANTLNFQILPKLDAPKADHLIFLTYSPVPQFENRELNKKLLKTIRDSGINELVTRACPAYAKEIGLHPFQFFYPSLGTLGKQYPELLNPEFPGHWFNPSVLTRIPGIQAHIDEIVKLYFARNPHLDKLFWDYEYSPFPGRGNHFLCHGESTFRIFAEEYKIAEKITPELLAGKYRSQWVEFTCGEIANMFRLFGNAAAKLNKPLAAYSEYESPATKELYNIDWNKISPAISMGYCGYGDATDQIEATRKALRGKPLVLGLLRTGIAASSDNAATIFRKVVESRGGVLLWYENLNDAYFLTQTAKAVTAAEKSWEFLKKGKRDDSLAKRAPGLSKAVAAFRLNNTGLLIFLNEGREARTLKALPCGFSGTLRNPDNGQIYFADREISITVPPEEIVILQGNLRK